MNEIEIQSRKDVVRDSHSKALVFSSSESREIEKNKKKRIKTLESKVNKLEEEMVWMKMMILGINRGVEYNDD